MVLRSASIIISCCLAVGEAVGTLPPAHLALYLVLGGIGVREARILALIRF